MFNILIDKFICDIFNKENWKINYIDEITCLLTDINDNTLKLKVNSKSNIEVYINNELYQENELITDLNGNLVWKVVYEK